MVRNIKIVCCIFFFFFLCYLLCVSDFFAQASQQHTFSLLAETVASDLGKHAMHRLARTNKLVAVLQKMEREASPRTEGTRCKEK